MGGEREPGLSELVASAQVALEATPAASRQPTRRLQRLQQFVHTVERIKAHPNFERRIRSSPPDDAIEDVLANEHAAREELGALEQRSERDGENSDSTESEDSLPLTFRARSSSLPNVGAHVVTSKPAAAPLQRQSDAQAGTLTCSRFHPRNKGQRTTKTSSTRSAASLPQPSSSQQTEGRTSMQKDIHELSERVRSLENRVSLSPAQERRSHSATTEHPWERLEKWIESIEQKQAQQISSEAVSLAAQEAADAAIARLRGTNGTTADEAPHSWVSKTDDDNLSVIAVQGHPSEKAKDDNANEDGERLEGINSKRMSQSTDCHHEEAMLQHQRANEGATRQTAFDAQSHPHDGETESIHMTDRQVYATSCSKPRGNEEATDSNVENLPASLGAQENDNANAIPQVSLKAPLPHQSSGFNEKREQSGSSARIGENNFPTSTQPECHGHKSGLHTQNLPPNGGHGAIQASTRRVEPRRSSDEAKEELERIRAGLKRTEERCTTLENAQSQRDTEVEQLFARVGQVEQESERSQHETKKVHEKADNALTQMTSVQEEMKHIRERVEQNHENRLSGEWESNVLDSLRQVSEFSRAMEQEVQRDSARIGALEQRLDDGEGTNEAVRAELGAIWSALEKKVGRNALASTDDAAYDASEAHEQHSEHSKHRSKKKCNKKKRLVDAVKHLSDRIRQVERNVADDDPNVGKSSKCECTAINEALHRRIESAERCAKYSSRKANSLAQELARLRHS